jgi:ElaB/YqjD/DUF883 family membrane-anchored ribosome-binding protein
MMMAMLAGCASAFGERANQRHRYTEIARTRSRLQKTEFYQRHRNLINIGIGTGAGALLGGLIGGKKGA